jgi:DNA-binding transcriptional MerR regulator
MPQEPARKDAYKTAEVCKAADVAPYVLKYWLTEFPVLAGDKSPNRVFSAREVAIIARIRQLLYDEGFTIAGAKKKIEAELSAGNFEGGAQPKKAASVPTPASAPAASVLPLPQAQAAKPPAPSVDPKKIAKELREILKLIR